MPSNQTANYNLSQWVKSDQVRMEDFNADNAKIDAAIKAVNQRVDGKASSSALSSLQSTVNGLASSKADTSALNSLSATVSSQGAALNKRGNCKIELTSYTGNGTYGPGTSTSIQFSQRPVVFFVMAPGTFAVFRGGATTGLVIFSSTTSDVSVSWSGSTAKLTTTNGVANWQLNANNTTYWVLALYDLS